MAFILMFTLQCVFPIFDVLQRNSTGISMVNTDTQTREFTVTVRAPNGGNAQTGSVTLNARAQRALMLREILGASAQPQSGWIRIDWGLPGCRSYMTAETDESLTGTDAGAASANVLLPHVSVNTGFTELNHTDTHIAIVNPNDGSANVIAQLSGADGRVRGTIPLSIAAQGSSTLRISEAFQNVLPDNGVAGKTFEGSLRLTSDAAIAAWQRIERPLSTSILRGRGATEIGGTNLAVIPHFVFGDSYDSVLNVLNPGTTALNLELTALDNEGSPMGEVVQTTLSPDQALHGSIPEIFRMVLPAVVPLPLFTGYVRIRESQGQIFRIAGDIEIRSSIHAPATASMLSPVSDTGSTVWTTLFAVSSSPYFTGYAIVNPNDLLTVQTEIQVEVINGSGVVVSQSTVQLAPREKQTALVVGASAGGYLRFTSNFPVHIMASVGTEDLRVLDQVPALR
jgi:hypothetical protein